ncbi:MAG: hypothetical protein EB828_02600 [Nitrosopumilus sp. D6]|nr:MAG: hypothetical protein EB828_02600 [Nitrosopumilus sp. D6]
MGLLSSIEYESILAYTPRPCSKHGKESKTTMYDLKKDNRLENGMLMSESIARLVKESKFLDYFTQNVVLIPLPRSSESQFSVTRRITTALSKIGLGESVECLKRIKAVPKSSTSKPENRPKAIEHYESMGVETLVEPKEIVLVDDVVTRGATILGAASRITEAFPNTKIRVFAVMRTISDEKEFSTIVDPHHGKIELRGEDTFRT